MFKNTGNQTLNRLVKYVKLKKRFWNNSPILKKDEEPLIDALHDKKHEAFQVQPSQINRKFYKPEGFTGFRTCTTVSNANILVTFKIFIKKRRNRKRTRKKNV